MNDADLKALLNADVPASDTRFVLAVMTRIEQRRFARERATTWGLGSCAMLLLAPLAPSLQSALEGAQVSNMTIALVLMTVTLLAPQFLRVVRD